MSEALNLNILSPERRLLEKCVVQNVTITGSEGQIQVLPGHASMAGTLEIGLFSYVTQDGLAHLGVTGTGFFEVADNEVSLLAESLELKGEIDVEKAKQSQREAEECLKAADLDEHTFKKYQAQLDLALARQMIASHEVH